MSYESLKTDKSSHAAIIEDLLVSSEKLQKKLLQFSINSFASISTLDASAELPGDSNL
jgi:hypothetical protein